MAVQTRFRDRADAGRRLAGDPLLERYRDTDAIVLGLARGGVPVAAEVARALELPLDVFVVRKLGTPGQPELAMGAVASGGVRVLNDDILEAGRIDPAALDRAVAQESAELLRRERLYRGDRPAAELAGSPAILIDDGLATGSSMLAAVQAVRSEEAREVVVAVPVAPEQVCSSLAEEVDEIVCAQTPQPFLSVGTWYEDFSQVSDEEVRRLLEAEH